MWQLARQPRWIAALFLALAIAAGFAALGQWQLSRSVSEGTVIDRATETAVALESVAKPDGPVTTTASGQIVTATGELVAGDFVILSGRLNGGSSGYWVVGHLQTGSAAAGPGLAVALGWTPVEGDATSAVRTLESSVGPVTITGRYLATESPQDDDFEKGEQNSASVAAFVNQWAEPSASVYGGYVIAAEGAAGLAAIDSPIPSTEVTLNWLNIFYAVEWVVFAVFAVFLWFRVVKDAWEREEEERADAAAAAEATAQSRVN